MPFTPTLNINLTAKQLSWATPRWKAAVDAKQTTAQSVEEWIWSLFSPALQSQFDQQTLSAAISWKPEETVEVIARRDDVTQQLQAIPVEKLVQVEALLAVTLDDSDEVAKRRSDAVSQLLSVDEETLQKVEAALEKSVDVAPIEEVPPPVEEVAVPVDPAPVPVEEKPVEEKPVEVQPVDSVEVAAPIEERPAGSEA